MPEFQRSDAARSSRLTYYLNILIITAVSACSPSGEQSPVPGLLLDQLRGRTPRVYFTNPGPRVAATLRFAARDRMLELIRRSRREIKLWVYGLDEPFVIAALLEASKRGVLVFVTGSPDQSYETLTQAFEREGVRLRLSIRRRSGLQHVKLAVFDHTTVFTGTGNFTRSGFLYNHNAFLELPIVPAYDDAWRDLIQDIERDEGSDDRFIDPATPPARRSPVFAVAPGVRAILAPGNGRLIQNRLTHAILRARRNVDFLIFSFTDPVIAAAFAVRARAGVTLRGIVDDPNNSGELDSESTAGRLNSRLGFAPAEIYLEGNRRVFAENSVFHGGHLHHKTLLIDDASILTGSYNWSLSARDRNLEILFVIEDVEIAADFRREFERIRSDAVLQARPPLANQTPGPAIFESEAGADRICVPGVSLRSDFTVFAGDGPYFRAFHFGADAVFERPAAQGPPHRCALLGDLSKSSSGINTGRRYLLPPEAPRANRPLPPCTDPRNCDPQDLRRVSLNEGWLWVAPESTTRIFTELRIWNRSGFAPALSRNASALPLTAAGAPGFYRFTPPPDAGSDALLFLKTADPGDGRMKLACVRYGAGLEPALREFLAAFAYERGFAPACATGE